MLHQSEISNYSHARVGANSNDYDHLWKTDKENKLWVDNKQVRKNQKVNLETKNRTIVRLLFCVYTAFCKCQV